MITSLKNGQESMDRRTTTVTDNVQKQMDAMNQSLVNLQHNLLYLAGVPESNLSNQQQCVMASATTYTILMGTQPVPLGGGRAR